MKLWFLFFLFICVSPVNAGTLLPDLDGDYMPDREDSCPETFFFTPNYRVDSDDDWWGNECDADYDNDYTVGVNDFVTFKAAYGSEYGDANYNPDVEHDMISGVTGDITLPDFVIFKALYGEPMQTGTNFQYWVQSPEEYRESGVADALWIQLQRGHIFDDTGETREMDFSMYLGQTYSWPADGICEVRIGGFISKQINSSEEYIEQWKLDTCRAAEAPSTASCAGDLASAVPSGWTCVCNYSDDTYHVDYTITMDNNGNDCLSELNFRNAFTPILEMDFTLVNDPICPELPYLPVEWKWKDSSVSYLKDDDGNPITGAFWETPELRFTSTLFYCSNIFD